MQLTKFFALAAFFVVGIVAAPVADRNKTRGTLLK
jgi:hypothetical protein